MINDTLKNMEEKMKKALEHTRLELVKIRTGKATTALLDGVKVEYYSQIVPLQQVANIAVQDVHTLNITPWDKTMLQPIDKAIQAANLGLNPIISGNFLRIPIPPLNEERRKELVKLIKKFGEDGKIAVRNLRRDAIEHIKKSEKTEHISEDERKKAEKNAQDITDKMIKEVDNLVTKKEKEIMEV